MITGQIQEYLRQSNVGYTVLPHAPAATALEEAATSNIPARHWAKTVVCFADGEPILVVLPADLSIDLARLRELAGASSVRLAGEDELDWLFPDCERGAMPPFGPLYKQRVFVDASLTGAHLVVFNGGTHAHALCMQFDDFTELVRPVVARFAFARAKPARGSTAGNEDWTLSTRVL